MSTSMAKRLLARNRYQILSIVSTGLQTWWLLREWYCQRFRYYLAYGPAGRATRPVNVMIILSRRLEEIDAVEVKVICRWVKAAYWHQTETAWTQTILHLVHNYPIYADFVAHMLQLAKNNLHGTTK